MNNIYARVIWPKTAQVKIKDYPYLDSNEGLKREIRIVDTIDSEIGYITYKNKTLFVTYRENFAFLVESKEIAHSISHWFNGLWQEGKTFHKN